MNLLFFTSDLAAGGAERVTATLANHWAGKGWSVTVLTYSGAETDEFALDRSVRRISLGVAAASNSVPGALGKNARRVMALREILRREKPDVAIGIQALPSCLLALAGRPHGGLSIGTERTFPPAIPVGKIVGLVRKVSYGRLDAVIALTNESADWIRRNTNARRAPVIFNPVVMPTPNADPVLDPARFLDPSRRSMLAAGRLVPVKGYDRLLRAFGAVAAAHPDWQLALVGEGPLRSELESLARELGIADQVIMPGRVGNMGDWYQSADAFVLTSLFEGFPNVLCEAMANGLPAVAVDCDTGPRTILRDEFDGLLVKQNDPGALISAMGRLMGDAALRHRLGENAKAIRERLSLRTIVAEWEALFADLREERLHDADEPRSA
jgi:glycosyltransferase involved in cell wall biosynthesis